MQSLLYIAASAAVASAIGGVTNYLAIRMLFHPRRELRVLGRRIPFTPGLIPKRQPEIADALGMSPLGRSLLLHMDEFQHVLRHGVVVPFHGGRVTGAQYRATGPCHKEKNAG